MALTSIMIGDVLIDMSVVSIGLTIVGILLSSGIAVLLYNFQKRSTAKLLNIQNNLANTESALNAMMDPELQAYRDLAPVISHCYSTALLLHPDKELKGGPPESDAKARTKWHRERSDELMKKAHTIQYITEANISFIPEKVLQSLNNFIDVCMNQAFDYALAYIPDADEKEDSEALGQWRERCYERNAEIKAAFEAFQSDLKARMDELKKGE